MANKYYVARDGQPTGPFTIEEMASQSITPDTMVWNETMTNWVAASSVSELSPLFNTATIPSIPNYGYQTQQNQPNICPKTYLTEAILVTIFCCIPFGIVGIVKASSVEEKFCAGNYDSAMAASKEARKWTRLGFFSGLSIVVLYMLSYVFLIVFAILER